MSCIPLLSRIIQDDELLFKLICQTLMWLCGDGLDVLYIGLIYRQGLDVLASERKKRNIGYRTDQITTYHKTSYQ